ncbi:DJ-1/PfpI family protein [Pseudomonas putida]|uniref:DJ-1/PfpI family protein n=1 Tax=Pseudomonas putida TaxID=303 RepID=UPI0022DE5B25|nr:DJ-1/PfpI family protein [Pseudomonas putida]WBM44726.1 DJ-1/PfpI family protein [Pseudomonas putida]
MNNYIVNPTSRNSTQLKIALVILSGFDIASLSVTLESIIAAKKKFGARLISYRTVGLMSSCSSSTNISITPDLILSETQLKGYEVIILMGGSEARLNLDSSLMEQLREAAKANRLLGGIWNGAYHLAAAGLTEGYECIINGDGRFTIEPPIDERNSTSYWQFDGRRMTSRDASSAVFMMDALWEHFDENLICNSART